MVATSKSNFCMYKIQGEEFAVNSGRGLLLGWLKVQIQCHVLDTVRWVLHIFFFYFLYVLTEGIVACTAILLLEQEVVRNKCAFYYPSSNKLPIWWFAFTEVFRFYFFVSFLVGTDFTIRDTFSCIRNKLLFFNIAAEEKIVNLSLYNQGGDFCIKTLIYYAVLIILQDLEWHSCSFFCLPLISNLSAKSPIIITCFLSDSILTSSASNVNN